MCSSDHHDVTLTFLVFLQKYIVWIFKMTSHREFSQILERLPGGLEQRESVTLKKKVATVLAIVTDFFYKKYKIFPKHIIKNINNKKI